MGLFDKIKKKKQQALVEKSMADFEKAEDINQMSKAIKPLFEAGILNEGNMFAEDLEHLTPEGNLPFGWHQSAPEIEEMDEKLGSLIDVYVNLHKSGGSVDAKIEIIHGILAYLAEYKAYCYGKNECYIKYFSDSYEHCHNSRNPDFTMQSQYEGFLQELLDNYDALKLRETLIKTLPDDLMNYLKANNGILQKDVYKAFDKVVKNDIQNLLYQWSKDGCIKREKEGSTYKITINP